MARDHLPALMKSLRLSVAFVLAGLVLAAPAVGAEERPRVLAIELDNDINPITADYVVSELERANEEDYDAAVIVLDTPGGLSSSMEEMYKAELASEVPVVVYVAPDGASATSAGVFVGAGGGHPRDGAVDDDRLVDADHRHRAGPRRGPPAQGRQQLRRRHCGRSPSGTAGTATGPRRPCARPRT